LGSDYFPKAVRGTPLHRLVTATTLYGYIEQGPSTISMSNPGDNGAPVDSVNRPAFGYILNLLCVCLLFKFYLSLNLNTCTCFALTGSLITVMNLLKIYVIKMYRKLPIYLTCTMSVFLLSACWNPQLGRETSPSSPHERMSACWNFLQKNPNRETSPSSPHERMTGLVLPSLTACTRPT
jgi:hypothetical protein